MGGVIRSRIKNILEAPLDVLMEFAGKGLEKIIGDDDTPRIAVKCGHGTELDENDAIRIKVGRGLAFFGHEVGVVTGEGLAVNNKNEIFVKPGDGIDVIEDQVVVKAGDGIGLQEGKVVVLPGDNLILKDGKVALDNIPEECNCSSTSFLVNSELSILGRNIILRKTFYDYTVMRNKAGFMLDMVLTNTRYEEDKVELPVEPGYVAMLSVPNRETTPKSPNFYKK